MYTVIKISGRKENMEYYLAVDMDYLEFNVKT